MRRLLQTLLIISICICFVFFLKGTNIKESILLIRQLGIYSAFIIISTFLAYISGTLGWKYCIDCPDRFPLVKLFMVRHIGNTITLFNPTSAIAGEMFNAKALIKEGMKEEEAYKSVLLSRILMILSQLTLLIILVSWFLFFLSGRFPSDIIYPVYICFFILLAMFPVLICFLLKEERHARTSLPDRKWKTVILRIIKMRSLLASYIRMRPQKTILAFLLFSAHWILGSLELFFILYFLQYNVDILDGLFLDTIIIVLKSTVSFIPGQLGIEELINKFVLHLIGISSPHLWLSVSILRRARQLFWSGIALIFYLYIRNRKKISENHGNIIRES
ncbi:lysylphosphatidylglycerol synthase transmembrane domain-containing protein [Dysgonomonas termitidis]|uniref:YbhN family protein n=1 Tax=Dysgonomonas termitidis TaxID=1516126 RepID=A0ABV9KQV0_9BACT